MDYSDITDETIKEALAEIAAKDQDLKAALAQLAHPYPAPRNRPDGFPALLNSVTSQQISIHAADAILKRVYDLMPHGVESAHFLELEEDDLRQAGLSKRKIEYITGIAQAECDGILNFESLRFKTDQEIIEELSALRGIGRWTAEIYAMFSLRRPDVFPADDLALQEALRRIKKLEKRPTGAQSRKLVEHWAPWRGIGALFLWHYYKGMPRFK